MKNFYQNLDDDDILNNLEQFKIFIQNQKDYSEEVQDENIRLVKKVSRLKKENEELKNLNSEMKSENSYLKGQLEVYKLFFQNPNFFQRTDYKVQSNFILQDKGREQPPPPPPLPPSQNKTSPRDQLMLELKKKIVLIE